MPGIPVEDFLSTRHVVTAIRTLWNAVCTTRMYNCRRHIRVLTWLGCRRVYHSLVLHGGWASRGKLSIRKESGQETWPIAWTTCSCSRLRSCGRQSRQSMQLMRANGALARNFLGQSMQLMRANGALARNFLGTNLMNLQSVRTFTQNIAASMPFVSSSLLEQKWVTTAATMPLQNCRFSRWNAGPTQCNLLECTTAGSSQMCRVSRR